MIYKAIFFMPTIKIDKPFDDRVDALVMYIIKYKCSCKRVINKMTVLIYTV